MSVEQYAVKLTGSQSGEVLFNPTPEVTESASTMYAELVPIRAPSSFLIYQGSASRTWTITGHFVSTTKAEASNNFAKISKLRAWHKPTESGQTPEVLTLEGYGDQFQSIPVVLIDLSLSFQSDTNYVFQSDTMPIVMPYSLTVKENHGDDPTSQFTYASFVTGRLEEW